MFFSRVHILCWLSYGVHSTHVLPRWNVKVQSCSAKSAGGRLHLNMHTLLTQWRQSGITMLSMHSVGTYQGNECTCMWSGNTCSQLFQITEPLWTDPGLKSGISMHELITTLKKKCRQGIICSIVSQIHACKERGINTEMQHSFCCNSQLFIESGGLFFLLLHSFFYEYSTPVEYFL